MQELRYALRRLGRHRTATFAAILTLASAIAAATVTWAIVSATLLRPVPGASDAARWYVLQEVDARSEGASAFVYPMLTRVREAAITERVAATWTPVETLRMVHAGVGGQLDTQFVTHDLLAGLGVPVVIGRDFSAADDRRGATPTGILSDRAWRQAFDASPAVIGQTLRLGEGTVTIVGVAAPGFRGLDLAEPPDLFVPLHAIDRIGSPLTNYFADSGHASSPTAGLRILVRPGDGDTPAAVTARLHAVLAQERATGGPQVPALVLTSLAAASLPAPARSGLSTFARLLATMVVLGLLVGAAAVGSLMFVRVEGRRAELATCLALGAPVARLIRGLALEAGLVAGAATLGALPLAWVMLRGLATFELPGRISVALLELRLDGAAVIAAFVAGLGVALLITAVAAAHAATRVVPVGASAPTTATPRPRRLLRDALLALQVAVALVLLAGAALFVRSLQRALDLNAGVGTAAVLRAELPLPAYGYDAVRAGALHDAWAARLSGHPAVDGVSVSADLAGMSPRGGLLVDGDRQRFATIVRFVAIDDAYFRTLRLPIVAGRAFTPDDRAGAPPVAVVSASMSRALAAERPVLGRRIAPPWRVAPGTPAPAVTVVGVVPDLVTDVGTLAPLTIYVPNAQHELGAWRTLTVRARGDVSAARREAQQVLRALDATVVPPPMPTLRERLARQMGPQRLGSAVLGGLGLVALLLTVLSTFVLADAMATYRLRELGIRAALGATAGGLMALLLRQTVRPVLIGVAAGLGLAVLGARTLAAFLFQIEPLDPATLGAVAGTLLAATVFSALLPALRVARLDVAHVLRQP